MRVFIPTCETAVCTIPEWHRADMKGSEEEITSPSGWSPGALNLAQGIAQKLHAQLLHADMSRLLIDLSKHPEDDERWSRFSQKLTPDQRQRLDERQKKYYLDTFVQRVEDALKRNDEIIHLSVDTRPNLGDTHIVFSYDSRSSSEADWVNEWIHAIRAQLPEVVIQIEGTPTRSLAGYMRTRFPANFSSVQIIVNQATFLEGKPIKWIDLKKVITTTVPR
ncbi:hypothetical protein ACFQY0_02825 [Haloferula chungangensis]|uniref:Uncharacterized protein n=1 Tax=Haloferula chungangensis TaxID=1048331 RepID=A0ABW2L350_9BACT